MSIPLPVSIGLEESTRNDSIIVTNASQIIANARSAMTPRKVITIRNIADDDTKIVTINFGNSPAVANSGIVLKRNESCSDSNSEMYLCHQGTITAICAVASATATIAIFER